MASYDIQFKYYNGSSYDTLYPVLTENTKIQESTFFPEATIQNLIRGNIVQYTGTNVSNGGYVSDSYYQTEIAGINTYTQLVILISSTYENISPLIAIRNQNEAFVTYYVENNSTRAYAFYSTKIRVIFGAKLQLEGYKNLLDVIPTKRSKQELVYNYTGMYYMLNYYGKTL